jgi:3-oxoacyl-[acyl-carrier protein] reductase
VDLGLKDRTAVVTGASGGIGREIARAYAAEGADVVVTYHGSEDDAAGVVAGIEEAGGRARAVRYALGDPASAEALVAAALDWTGRIDVLVNNAVEWFGRFPDPDLRFEELADDEWVPGLRRNIEGAVQLTRLAVPGMRERGWGRVTHVSTGGVVEGVTGEYYTAAKAALHGFNRASAFNLGPHGVLTNVVMPGFTRTARNAERADAHGHRYAERAPIRRLLDAAEVARAVVFLGSAANTGITGQVIGVTGGVS